MLTTLFTLLFRLLTAAEFPKTASLSSNNMVLIAVISSARWLNGVEMGGIGGNVCRDGVCLLLVCAKELSFSLPIKRKGVST